MRVAVASEGLDVSPYFNCCTDFNYYQVENGRIMDSRNLPSQGHLCGSQANFLRQLDVKVLICGSISPTEIASIEQAGMTVVSGATGRAIDAVQAYLHDEADLEDLLADPDGEEDEADELEGPLAQLADDPLDLAALPNLDELPDPLAKPDETAAISDEGFALLSERLAHAAFDTARADTTQKLDAIKASHFSRN